MAHTALHHCERKPAYSVRCRRESDLGGSAEGSRYLRERRYAPVRANVRDPLTTLNIEQLKLVSNIERSNFAIKRRSQ
jgi:hypothetical protein